MDILQKKKLLKIIRKNLDFLRQEQKKDGSFASFSSSARNKIKNSLEYNLTFPTSLIAFSLQEFSDIPIAQKIRQKAVKFLLAQASQNFSLNYWTRNSKESRDWPDDIDDTFCAMLAINSWDKHLIDGEKLAKLVSLLTLVETKEGGPYKTW